jgi:hypothetical protein
MDPHLTGPEHPITPPPELVEEWWAKAINKPDADALFATSAAQWGYQQAVEELESFLRKNHDKG